MLLTKVNFTNKFKVVLKNKKAEVAEMVISNGESEGGRNNSHRGCDQWLFVISGKGEAIINEKRHSLKAGSLVLIEEKENHEIRNIGKSPLKTLNIYVPPAYTKSGNTLPSGRNV